MAQIASLVPQSVSIPKPDFSWLDGLASSVGDAIDERSTQNSFNKFADRIGGGQPAQQPQASFLSRLTGQPSQQAQTAPVAPVARSVVPSGNQQDFINSILPAAIEEGKRTGVDPRIIVAQAAQETGWGKSAPGNNLFGIKSHGQSGGNSLMTTEYVNGQPVSVRDSFRGYASPADSVKGYGDFITQNPRYTNFRNAQGLDAQLAELQASGYATDPNYSRSVGAIARGIQLPDGSNVASASDAVNAMADGSLASAFSGDGPQPQAQQAIQQAAPNQVAQQGGNIIAPGVTPITRGSVDPSLIQYMLRDRNLREAGLKLWAANVQGQSPGEPWQFVTLPDGTLARANQQTGAVESLGQFAKPNAGYTVLSQEERQQLGIPSTDTRVYQKGADGKIDAVGGVGQTINIGNEVDQRRAAAAQAGLSPNDPGYQGFILTGKLPRENEQSLTATDKKAILEADEMVQNTQNVLPLIDRALELNDKAYSGPTAGVRGMITGAFGADGGEATQELDNVVINGALTQLKAIFGGAPTEGERSILLAMSGASNQPAPVRKTIFERARQAAQRRLDFYQQRANDMRGGTYYKPGSNTPAQSAPASGGSADIQAARDAIARGAPREAVIKRLQDAGIDTEGL